MMALNWDAFLNNESLDVPNDDWSDFTTLQTGLTSEMPKPTVTDISRSTHDDVTNFDPLLNGSSVDPYFDDSVFISNDYFLSDLEVLHPFGNTAGGGASTSESSPEPLSANSLSPQNPALLLAELNQLPQITMAQRQALQRANTLPNHNYESMFPNNMDTGFVEDLTFPDGPKGVPSSSKPSLERAQTAINTTTKRNKNKNKPDILSACWTSPLCPNHDQDGPPPNPSSCGGGCAPFLFANDDALPIIQDLLTEPQEVTAADGIVEIQPRPKKRSESDTSKEEPSGRYFTSNHTTASPADNRQRMKSEVSEDSPNRESPQAIDDKPKSRRRLPHNQVERKYRESLNTQLESLRKVVPSLQQSQGVCDGADIEDLPTASKPSKAVILASATAYIKQQEKDRKSLEDENHLLKSRIKALQALVKCDDCSLMQYVMDLKINQAKQ
ncbi:hypothetical protein CC86DRAFT_117004 [Ophiobolus disseminans]|uniref:BHLH domain-containing protein n=1 Tax=Ophiobolus disseminans TaxID=1469910 RepID=A0A6A6ZIA9_9PLEO|nr:hypothetical protein CC86DRAFT_117004 [Ophiobolus disseminans]